jgi:hypothetical protein
MSRGVQQGARVEECQKI